MRVPFVTQYCEFTFFLSLVSLGRSFDIADRTFRDTATTWWLSSSESATDVKELIPEFFYLPEFLMNTERKDCQLLWAKVGWGSREQLIGRPCRTVLSFVVIVR